MALDWDEITKTYRVLSSSESITAFRLPTKDELEAFTVWCALDRQAEAPLDLSPWWGQQNERHRDFPGLPQLEEQMLEFNDDLSEAKAAGGTLFLLEQEIEARDCSNEFLNLWGGLYNFLGRHYELRRQEDDARKQFSRNMNSGLTQNTTAQRYWHAHWVHKHQGKGRNTAEFELAELCKDLHQGNLKAPASFRPDWFGKMIQEDARLKSAYVRATAFEIERRVQNQLVPAEDILPPLSRAEFL